MFKLYFLRPPRDATSPFATFIWHKRKTAQKRLNENWDGHQEWRKGFETEMVIENRERRKQDFVDKPIYVDHIFQRLRWGGWMQHMVVHMEDGSVYNNGRKLSFQPNGQRVAYFKTTYGSPSHGYVHLWYFFNNKPTKGMVLSMWNN